MSITGNAAAGIIAFGPLGPEYLGVGILAAMVASIIAGAIGAVTGGAPGMVSGPRATTAMLFAGLLTQLLGTGQFDLASPRGLQTVLTLAFAAVLLSGVMQALLGVFRVGGMVKFIPYPVVAGIRNTAAILLIRTQIWPFLGIEHHSILSLGKHLRDTQPLTLLVAVVTAVVAWQGARLLPRATVAAVALVAGAALHHALVYTVGEAGLGPLLGRIPSAIPRPSYLADLAGTFLSTDWLGFAPIVLSGAAAMAVLDSISALINLVALQSMANQRLDASRQLIGQGVGNVAGAVFGGLPASGIFARIAVNYRAGGRTRLSSVFNSLTILLLVIALAGPLGLLPRSAIAGLIVVIAVGLFDRWSFGLVRDAFGSADGRNHDALVNVAQMAFVVAVGVAVNLVWAVAAGVAVSILVFVVQMSRSPIRNVRSGTAVRSKTRRDAHRTEILIEQAERVAVVELEGTVFFGSADSIAVALDELAEGGVKFIVVDMKRVRRVDVTGYRVLSQIHERLRKAGVHVGFSYVAGVGSDGEAVRNLTVSGPVSAHYMFETTDEALEAFEDRLLLGLGATVVEMFRWTPTDIGRWLGLDEKQTYTFATYLAEIKFKPGDLVCRQGEPGDSMFFISLGSAEVTIPIPGQARHRRLATLTQGTVFGEMSLLDGRPRSADIRAKELLICYELTMEAFTELARHTPEIAMTVYSAIGQSLGSRLRESLELIAELDV